MKMFSLNYLSKIFFYRTIIFKLAIKLSFQTNWASFIRGTTLYGSINYFGSLSGLENYTFLKQIYLDKNWIKNVEILRGFNQVEILKLSNKSRL